MTPKDDTHDIVSNMAHVDALGLHTCLRAHTHHLHTAKHMLLSHTTAPQPPKKTKNKRYIASPHTHLGFCLSV